MRVASASALLLLLLAACTTSDPGGAAGAGGGGGEGGEPPIPSEGITARFDPQRTPRGTAAESWLSFPWPADLRRADDGTIELQDFPNPDDIELLHRFADTGEATLRGFSLSGGLHVAFDGAIDPASLPADAAAFAAPGAVVQLVDVTEGSPTRGRRVPLRWEVRASGGKYVPANTLSVGPAWGFPLRESTTWALLVTDALRGADGLPARPGPLVRYLLRDDAASGPASLPAELRAELHASWAPVRALLHEEGFDTSRVVVGTVFTTQDATGELRAVKARLDAAAAPALQNGAWQTPRNAEAGSLVLPRQFEWAPGERVLYSVMEGRLTGQNFQEGEVPYADEGGRLSVTDGVATAVREESLRFVLAIPDAALAPGACFPIVEVAHGTGGNAYSFVGDGTAGRLAARGLASISLDQPLHGPRAEGKSFDVDRMSFNFLNPDAARGAFRQSAIDTFVLTRFVRESLRVDASVGPGGRAICFDPRRVGFFGHSHGGLSGAIAAGLEEGVAAFLLSGGGGGFTITVLERKDIEDIAALVKLLLGMPDDEALTELHPVMSLVQLLTDVTDPLSYAPYWSARASKPNLLITSGEHDLATPWRTAQAMALAGGVPIVAPVVLPIPGWEAAGMAPIEAPVEGNVEGATQGFLQWTDDVPGEDADSHWLVFYRPEAIHASMRFLQTSAAGTAVIERDPASDAR